jgi:hypothetical protein
MTDLIPINALTDAAALTGTELMPVVQGGETRKAPINGVVAIVQANVQGAVNDVDAAKANKVTLITAAGLVTGGGDLSANRTLTVTEASDADADAGTAGNVVMTPRRATRHLNQRRGAANGVASLGAGGIIPSAQIPSLGTLGAVPESRTVTAGGLVTGGGALTGNVTVTVTEASDAEAAAGTAADKVITPRRLKTVADTKMDKSRQFVGAGLATGGGDGTADRTITVTEASSIETAAGTAGDKVITPRRLKETADTKADKARQLVAAGLVQGGGDLTADRTLTVPEATDAEALAGASGVAAMTPRRVKTTLDNRILLNPADGIAVAVLDDFENVALALTSDGKEMILPWVTLRMEQGKLQFMMSERTADTLTPAITRTVDGKLSFGPDGQQIVFDPASGQLQAGPAIFTYTAKGLVVSDEHGATVGWISADGLSTIIPGLDYDGASGRTAIGPLTLVQKTGGAVALIDDLDQCFAEIGMGTPSFFSGWTLNPDGRLSFGGRDVIVPTSWNSVPVPVPLAYAPDTDTAALIAAQWIAQSFLRRVLQQNTMAIFKRNDAYSHIRKMWIMDANDEQAAGLCWKTKSGTLSKNGTTAGRFIRDRAYTGNLIDFWIGTGYDLSTDTGLTTAGDWLVGIECKTSGDSSVWDIGASDTFKVACRVSGKLRAYLGSSTLCEMATDSPVNIIWFGRQGGQLVMALNGDEFTTFSGAGSVVPAGELRIFGGFGSGALFSNKSIAKAVVMDTGTTLQRQDMVEGWKFWSKQVASYVEPSTSSKPFVTTDQSYRERTSLEIPCKIYNGYGQTLTGSYGTRGYPLGTTGEGAPATPINGRQEGAYASFHQSRDLDKTQTWAFSVVATGAANASMNDPQGERNSDGRAVLLIPSTGPRKTVWGILHHNPTAAPADMRMEPPAFQGYGYTGRPRMFPDGTMRVGYYEMLPNDTGRVYPAGMGCHYYKLEVIDNAIVSTYLSTVPPPDAFSDGDGLPVNNFQEPSFMPLIGGGVICFFRTGLGLMWSRSMDELTWSAPQRLMIDNLGINTSSQARCDLWRHSSGRPILFLCNDPARDNMTMVVGPVGGDGLTWEQAVLVDDRDYCSYPSSCEIFDSIARDVLVSYDLERGRFGTLKRRLINTAQIGLDMVIRDRSSFNI